MSHESLSGEAYVLNTRMRKPATYQVILAAAGELRIEVKGALRETNSLNYARTTIANNLGLSERISLGESIQAESQIRLLQNPYDRVARSALRFGRRVEREARGDQKLFLMFHS
ncbi:MAG: hypothetical protein KA035_00370 [Candidatus Levybacteria bacterium]|nr:hypothetical protein [Candidatus Levybacteria bacterium]